MLVLILSSAALAQTSATQDGSPYRVVGAGITGASEVKSDQGLPHSSLELISSDAALVEGFQRAKRQAMAYVFDGDPVGPWYEAAEPGREAFCMRDVAHQSLGAQALGLARYNLNLLRRFAENVSDSKDWCSYWEIDRFNRPAPVDYWSDSQFWYNLPANFDILDACYRMYLWSGDPAYVTDPAFLNFYDRTVTDYVERWGLGLDQIMTRPRLLNVRGLLDPKKKFQAARGIPGYDEGNHEYTAAADLLATQYAAYLAYARIQEVRGKTELARTFLKKAGDVKAFINSTWWNQKDKSFYARVSGSHELEGRGGGAFLYWNAVEDGPKVRSALVDSSAAAGVPLSLRRSRHGLRPPDRHHDAQPQPHGVPGGPLFRCRHCGDRRHGNHARYHAGHAVRGGGFLGRSGRQDTFRPGYKSRLGRTAQPAGSRQ